MPTCATGITGGANRPTPVSYATGTFLTWSDWRQTGHSTCCTEVDAIYQTTSLLIYARARNMISAKAYHVTPYSTMLEFVLPGKGRSEGTRKWIPSLHSAYGKKMMSI